MQAYFCDARLACFSRSLCFEVGRVPLPLSMRLRRVSLCKCTEGAFLKNLIPNTFI